MSIGNDSESYKLFEYESRTGHALDHLNRQAFAKRLWNRDVSLWRQDEKGDKSINNRLGWMSVVDIMKDRVDEIVSFASEIGKEGFTHAVLMGMGGSSLSPEVSRLTFGVRAGFPDLMVLDSTVPAAVLEVEGKIDLARTLFIVSTKSGTTVETLSAYKYFHEKVKAVKGDKAAENFIAIIDPGPKLDEWRENRLFRKIFTNFTDIGGRYSALSYFGLVPAAVIGADIGKLLDRASDMMRRCSAETPVEKNPGITLGVALAELALQGRDKMTLIMSPEIASFGSWVEQLVAESTGKNGRGVVPVDLEPLADPDAYGDDRVFVYMRLKNSPHAEKVEPETLTPRPLSLIQGEGKLLDMKVSALIEAALPTIILNLEDTYDLGGEYFRWELATGTTSALLGVNAFDEPNVTESKNITMGLLDEFGREGKLPADSPIIEEDGIKLFCDAKTKGTLDDCADGSLKSYLKAFVELYQPGNYVAMMAFIKSTPEIDANLQMIRGRIGKACSAATTLGYGPRFLHSTGQLHKGGANNGIFIQFTSDDATDVAIPGRDYSFSVLKTAQSLGDAKALQSKGRPLIRIHLGADAEAGLKRVLEIL